MRAVVLNAFGGAENFTDAELPAPAPGPGEVRIRARAVSVNPTDCKARRGTSGGDLPMILGRDAAGVVEAAGAGAGRFAPGAEVMAYLPRFGGGGGGGYAECVCAPEAFVVPKPAGLSFAQAAAVPLVSLTAWEAVVMKARIERGESALVAGASGGVGTMAVQMLRHLGAAPVLATAGSAESAAYIEGLGVSGENILRYPGLSLDEMAERVVAMNGGRLPRAAFDFVGREMKRLCCRVVDYFGRIVSIAPEPGAPVPEFFSSTEGPLFTKSASFHAVFLRAPVRGGGPAYYGPYAEALEAIRGWLEAGSIAPPAITEMGPLAAGNIARAHGVLEEGHVRGKLVLSVGGEG